MNNEEAQSSTPGTATTRPLVIYHSPCLDGFTAAWAMWLKHPDAEFVPGVYGQDPPDCADRDVYLLDFSYKADMMYQIAYECKSLTVLDHHKTAVGELHRLSSGYHDATIDAAKLHIVFDMEKSGARLAWEWFHPGTTVPLFVRLVEDRDLWRFALDWTRELNADFFSYDYDFKYWSHLHRCCDDRVLHQLHRNAGAAILRKQDKDIRELLAHGRHELAFGRGGDGPSRVPAVNLPYTMASEAGNLLARGAPFAAVYYQDGDGYKFSLRSEEGGADVSEVASRYGGGGHKHAAGFRVKSLEGL
jgi:uncharacterized protein